MSYMKADKTLERDINKANSYEDLMDLLHNSLERSNIAFRDPETGQFVRRDPLTPATQTLTEDEEITKTETIGGQEFTFTGAPPDVERAIADAYRVAQVVQPPVLVTPQPNRPKTQAERERDIFDRTQLELQLRRGELTTAEFLDRTNAIGEYLAEKGFDIEAAAGKQLEQSWQQAVELFYSTPEGQTWRGGQKNLELMGNLLQSHGLMNAPDKVAALRAMAAEMREKGLEFDGDYSEQQMIELTNTAKTPQEILEAWKESHGGDPEAANAEFIRLHQGGRFFDR